MELMAAQRIWLEDALERYGPGSLSWRGAPELGNLEVTTSPVPMPQGDDLIAAAQDIATRRARVMGLRHIEAQARHARVRIVGTDDPAKLAEYADKAAWAPQIIEGAAPEDVVAAARAEALDLGMEDGEEPAEVQLARIWKRRAAELRDQRNQVNKLERAARAAITAASSAAEVRTALNQIGVALSALPQSSEPST